MTEPRARGDRDVAHLTTVAGEPSTALADGTRSDSGDGRAAAPQRAWSTGVMFGRYVVLERLGEGGMGVVHRAYDPDLRREVALKVVRVAGPATARDRLSREAQALARVTHPHVVTVYDVGVAGPEVFVAMELVRGATLAEWRARAARSPAQLLAVFRAAGEGLAAAHAAGLVHRDFKPSNVMVGDDGRVRVLDFGLARPIDDAEAAPGAVASPDHLGQAITRHGAVVGTPQYMAPEQRDGRTADARSDQYAFCLALCEALAGALPDRAPDGAIAALPALPGAPRAIRGALERGLSSDPAARFPSMTAVLDAITPRRKRWIAVAAIGAAAAAAAAIALVVARSGGAGPPPCAAVAEPFQAMWDPPARDRIRAGFVANGGLLAGATWARVAPRVDAWGHTWIEMRREACAATQLRGEQSPTMMDLRMTCLDDRRHELASLLDVFRTADRDVVASAIKAIDQLEPIARCADTAALSAVSPPPLDKRDRVARAKLELDAIAAAVRANRIAGTVERATTAVAAAVALGYAPLEAEARFQLGAAQTTAGTFEAALASLDAAALAADRGGDDRLRARAWLEVVFVAGTSLRRSEPALRARDMAVAALARVRDPGPLLVTLHTYTAAAYLAIGQHADGLAEADRALALVAPSTDHLLHANALNQKALILYELTRYDEAIAIYGRARQLYEAAFGPDHPRIAAVISNTANAMALHSPNYAEVERMQREALAIGERSFGRDHPQVATYANNVVNLLLRVGRFEDALPLARRAVEIRERALPPDHPFTVRALVNLAATLVGLGRFGDAEALYVRGLAMQARSLPPEHLDVAYVRRLHGLDLLELGRAAEAGPELAAAYAIYRKLQSADSPMATEVMAWQARADVDAGDPARGLARADKALALALAQRRLYTEGVARWHRARALIALGRAAEARAEARAAITELAKQPVPDTTNLRVQIERWLAATPGLGGSPVR